MRFSPLRVFLKTYRPADVPVRRYSLLFPFGCVTGGSLHPFFLPLKKEIGMRRTFLLLFSAAVALLLVCGAVLTLPSEKPDDTPMVDGRVRAILFTEVPEKTRFCEVTRCPSTLSQSVLRIARHTRPFRGSVIVPTRLFFLSRALKRCLPVYTRANAGTPQTLRSAPLDKPIMVGCVCL